MKGTINFGILLGGQNQALTVYFDSDYAGNLDNRKSTTGVVCMMLGGPIAWLSKRQKCVSQSSTEAECVAASAASKDAVWIRQLLKDIQCEEVEPTLLLCDNQGAIQLVHNPEQHNRTKHIDVKYHLIRSLQEAGTISVRFIRTSKQIADMLTKPLDGPTFLRLRADIGVCDINAV